MADVTQPRSVAANGTTTPATATLTGVQNPDLLICVIAVLGTSPTLATPTGGAGTWVQIQKTSGATLTVGMYYLANAATSSYSPSAVLGGTVTGWAMTVFEFTAVNNNTALQGSAQLVSAIAQLTNVFPTTGNTLSNELFVYAVARATATITASNTFLTPGPSQGPLSAWSASVLPQAGVQGLSMDFYWASGLGQGIGQYPSASGLLSGAVASVAIGAYFNTLASNATVGTSAGGQEGVYVPQFCQGLTGG